LVDVSVVEAFESSALELHDFFTGDDYRYHFEVDAKQRFIALLRERFNFGVTYRGRVLKWDTVIEQKTNELGRFLAGKSSSLDFLEPEPKLERQANRELRAKILQMTPAEANQLCIGNSTLHYLRKRAESNRSFYVHRQIPTRINRIR
jgi:hypothetical protein